MKYTKDNTATLIIRLDEKTIERLKERAKQEDKKLSQLVREILKKA